MKKGLSVLLIVAALFGFYGGATSLNDILASKDYWEEVGEKSTADMNKLEDGLNQLKDNEQAYLDGKEQLAEGEKALAEGEAAYAAGLAAYEAAPAELAEGEAKLAKGYSDFNDLKKLISGLNTVRKHGTATTKDHQTYWHDAFSFKGSSTQTPGLEKGRETIQTQMTSSAMTTLLGAIDMMNPPQPQGTIQKRFIGAESSSYATFDKNVAATKKNFDTAAGVLGTFKTNLFGLQAPAKDAYTKGEYYRKLPEGTPEEQKKAAKDAYDKANATFKGACKDFDDAFGDLTAQLPNLIQDPTTKAAMVGLFNTISAAAVYGDVPVAKQGGKYTSAIIYGGLATQGDLIKTTIQGYIDTLKENSGLLDAWDKGYTQLAAAKDGKGSDDLASKSEGIPYAFSQMLSNKTIKSALKTYDKSLIPILRRYTGNRLANEDLDDFDDDLTYIARSVIPRAQSVLAKVRSSAVKQLADGEQQLADGYASYNAAPAQLADAEKQLADGKKQLEDGKKQLAQYEDGEQQVRDGLATLMATEADPGLESILDRRNGDDKFDDANGHLDLTEGLEAVDVGRGYQADSGELITKEITNRAIGTAAGLAAGALAVLAAILSFLKKNKGAAVSAVLAAVAGGVGAGVGLSAGEYYSDIAGSTVGNTPFIAAAILAAVAAVFAIFHFTAKPEAKEAK